VKGKRMAERPASIIGAGIQCLVERFCDQVNRKRTRIFETHSGLFVTVVP
jgi:hypothetical protein